jgi:hypothetical protein
MIFCHKVSIFGLVITITFRCDYFLVLPLVRSNLRVKKNYEKGPKPVLKSKKMRKKWKKWEKKIKKMTLECNQVRKNGHFW